MSVATAQRFSKTRPCPICGGFDAAPRGTGQRCFGYLADDGEYAHCTREEHAGALTPHLGSDTFAHKLSGDCRCGVTHGPAPVRRLAPTAAAPRRIVATYDYRDEQGQRLFQALRYDPKDFSQRRPNGRDGWIYNLEGVRRVLYRLPELLASERDAVVYLVEGEKDVDRLRSLGLVVTCNPQGAGKWRAEYADSLRERHVVILPDNDDAGQRHAQQVATALSGAAASIAVLDLPGLPSKGDASDWLNAGGNVAQLERLAAEAPAWEPPAAPLGYDAQDASKPPEVPLDATISDTLRAYVERLTFVEDENTRLRTRLAETEAELTELRTANSLYFSVLRNKSIPAAERITYVAAINLHASDTSLGKVDDAGFSTAPAWKVAEAAGQPESTVSRQLQRLGQDGLLERKIVKDVAKFYHRETGQITERPIERVLIRLSEKDLNTALQAAALAQPQRKRPGGFRPRCPKHPNAGTVTEWTLRCAECGEPLDSGRIEHQPSGDEAESHYESWEPEALAQPTIEAAAPESHYESTQEDGATEAKTATETGVHVNYASQIGVWEPAPDAIERLLAERLTPADRAQHPLTLLDNPGPATAAERGSIVGITNNSQGGTTADYLTGRIARDRPDPGTSPSLALWKVSGVCLDCGGPLPPGAKYRCAGCVAFAALGGAR